MFVSSYEGNGDPPQLNHHLNSQTEEEKQAKKAEKEKQEAELKRLSDEHTVLAREFSRNERMRKVQGRLGFTDVLGEGA